MTLISIEEREFFLDVGKLIKNSLFVAITFYVV